jgi:hypothetical protein
VWVNARHAFLEYRDALRRRGPPFTDQERHKLYSLWDAWEDEYRRFPGGRVPGVPGGLSYVNQPPPSRELVEVEFGAVEAGSRDVTMAAAGLPSGRSPEEPLAEARVHLRIELQKKLDTGKPSLRSIERRMRELGYPVSYRRVRETWQEMKPE